MSWRDNPEIIWSDEDGDRLEVEFAYITTCRCDGSGGFSIVKPESLADRVEATERWLAALGLTADNIRELPRPVEAGDTVGYPYSSALWRVVHVDGDTAMLRPADYDGAPLLAAVDDLYRAEPPSVSRSG